MAENFFVDTNQELLEKVREQLAIELGGQFRPLEPSVVEAALRRVRGYLETNVREAELPATDFAVAGYRVARKLEGFVSRELAIKVIGAAMSPAPPALSPAAQPAPLAPPPVPPEALPEGSVPSTEPPEASAVEVIPSAPAESSAGG